MTLYQKINTDFSKHYLGYSAIAIIASTCIGSIAIMYTLINGHDTLQMFMVFLSVAVCSAHNAAILTLQKPKIVLNLLITSLVINILLIIINLAQ